MEIVHCLTLSHIDDRILSVSREAMRQGFGLYFHEAFYAEERKDTATAITRGHKKIVQFAKDNKLPYIIVCEDDIFFYGDDNKAFQYFIDNTPPSYDLYMGVVLHGEIKENRVMNGMSGSHTLIKIHERFYNFILNEMPDNCYQDRYLGGHAHRFEYYTCPLVVCNQKPGYSYNRKVIHTGYDVYLEGRAVYGRG